MSIVGYALLAIFYLRGNNFEEIMYIIVLAAIILLIIPIINLKYTFIDVSITLLGFLYVGVLFSFIPIVNSKIGGEYLVWLIFLGSWIADTTAYYSGKYLGKERFVRRLVRKRLLLVQ